MSNQIQNDWSQTGQLEVNNEGHHSGGGQNAPTAQFTLHIFFFLLSSTAFIYLKLEF